MFEEINKTDLSVKSRHFLKFSSRKLRFFNLLISSVKSPTNASDILDCEKFKLRYFRPDKLHNDLLILLIDYF